MVNAKDRYHLRQNNVTPSFSCQIMAENPLIKFRKSKGLIPDEFLYRTAYFSMDLSTEQLLERMILSSSRIDFSKARKSGLSTEDSTKVSSSGEKFCKTPIYIDDTSRLSPSELRERCKAIGKRQSIKIIVVDSLQTMIPEQCEVSMLDKYANLTKSLRDLAVELDVCVIVLCNLDLPTEQPYHEVHKSRINSLGESAIVERYADIVMLLHRDDYYCLGEPDYERSGFATVTITKNRNGPKGIVTLKFLEEYVRFENLTCDQH